MKITETKIEGLFVIDALRFQDLRGELIKPFNFNVYNKLNINLDFKETWFTKSKKNVIRAMHLQIGEMACEKLVSVINGSVLDVVLDLRSESRTFGEYFEIELNDIEPKALYIPQGCAHGYKVLQDNTITMYSATKVHSAEHDLGIRWNSFGYDWQVENPILSDKDINLIEFKDFK
ncbi:dTDP-4-dehydrorhamnose 3,5-epimerase family protein [Flavobacterium aquidurense]|uniref:dTDP-4-dehydrorhamnose 3,5-epimerase family protein n=1 Tax=Flavobacterium aquidurense TaxID=362413 RepID=UPI003721F4CE